MSSCQIRSHTMSSPIRPSAKVAMEVIAPKNPKRKAIDVKASEAKRAALPIRTIQEILDQEVNHANNDPNPHWVKVSTLKSRLKKNTKNLSELCDLLLDNQVADKNYDAISAKLDAMRKTARKLSKYQVCIKSGPAVLDMLDALKEKVAVEEPKNKDFKAWKGMVEELALKVDIIYRKAKVDFLNKDGTPNWAKVEEAKPIKQAVPLAPAKRAAIIAKLPAPSPIVPKAAHKSIPLKAAPLPPVPKGPLAPNPFLNHLERIFKARNEENCDVHFMIAHAGNTRSFANSIFFTRALDQAVLHQGPLINRVRLITLKSCTQSGIEAYLHKLYTDQPLELNNVEDAFSLYHFFLMFHVDDNELIQQCLTYIKNSYQVHPDLFSHLVHTFPEAEIAVLGSLVEHFIQINSEKFFTSAEFKRLNLEQVVDILSEKQSPHLTPQKLFKIACYWLESQPESEDFVRIITTLMDYIDFEKFSHKEFMEEVSNKVIHGKYLPLSLLNMLELCKATYKN